MNTSQCNYEAWLRPSSVDFNLNLNSILSIHHSSHHHEHPAH